MLAKKPLQQDEFSVGLLDCQSMPNFTHLAEGRLV